MHKFKYREKAIIFFSFKNWILFLIWNLKYVIYPISNIDKYHFFININIWNLICVILMQIIMKDEGRNSNIEIN